MGTGNKDNLISLADRTTEEQRIIATKGGIASGEARRRKKLLKECIDALLEKVVSVDESGEDVTGADVLAVKLYEEAKNGNMKDWELLRDTANQKPAERVVVSNIDPDVINQVERMVNDDV